MAGRSGVIEWHGQRRRPREKVRDTAGAGERTLQSHEAANQLSSISVTRESMERERSATQAKPTSRERAAGLAPPLSPAPRREPSSSPGASSPTVTLAGRGREARRIFSTSGSARLSADKAQKPTTHFNASEESSEAPSLWA